jgi:hypothetical protein
VARLSSAILVFWGLISAALAQQATPTTNVLTRTLMIESRYGRGTTFSLDVDNREYWITAKHLLTGAEHPPYGSIRNSSVSLRLLNPDAETEKWMSVNFSVIDAGKDVDIVALAPQQPILNNPIPSLPTTSAGVMLGGDCEFLGFPYGGGWRATWKDAGRSWMPYTKHCTISAMASGEPGEPKVWVLDGINNAGFSGGPVVSRTGAEQQIFGVLSGYHLEPTEVISSISTKKRKEAKSRPGRHLSVNLNSGFIIVYDISSVIDAIHKNPIGPLRTSP